MKRAALIVCVALFPVTAAAQTHSGTLDSGDATRDGGQYVDTYEFQTEESQRVTVTMTGDFDTYLIVESPSGEQSINDDFAPGTSQVDVLAGEAGTWRVLASAYGGSETGAYEIVITPGATGTVEVQEGRLDTSDTMGIKGEYYDTHTIQVSPGVEFFVELVSLGFDGYLSVRSPSGEMWRNDDTGSTSLARVGPLRGAEGDWTVYATSNSAEEVGAYDLRVTRFE